MKYLIVSNNNPNISSKDITVECLSFKGNFVLCCFFTW